MKKLVKKVATVLVVAFALLGAGGTVLAASGYITWPGSDAYNNIKITLEQIKQTGQELKTERDMSNQTNEQLVNQIKDKENIIKDRENTIKAKEQEVAAKQKEIDELKNSSTNNSDQLKQAETDMKDIDQKAKDALNSLR